MAVPTLQAEGAMAVNTTGTLAVTLPAHQANDILVLTVQFWGPNTAGDAASIPIPAGWSVLNLQLGQPTASPRDGWFAIFWKRAASSSEANPTLARGASWDTGTDTLFAARAYTIRGCITSGNPWDAANVAGAYTTANQNTPALTGIAGNEHLSIHFEMVMDNVALGSLAGWTQGTVASSATATGARMNTLRKQSDNADEAAGASGATAPAHGGYAFYSVSFVPAVVSVSPGGVASAEALGTAQLNQNVTPAGVASGEAIGAASLALNLSALGAVASAEAGGTPSLGLSLAALGQIATAEALGAAVLAPGAVAVSPSGIGSSESVPAPLLTTFTQIAVSGIASAENVPVPVLAALGTIAPSGVASAEAVPSPVLTSLAQVLPGAIGSLEAVGSPNVIAVVTPAGVGSAEALGSPALAETVAPSGIASAAALGQPTVLPGSVTLVPVAVGSGEALGAPVVLPGPVTVTPVAILSDEVFGVPAVVVVVAGFPGSAVAGDALVGAGGTLDEGIGWGAAHDTDV